MSNHYESDSTVHQVLQMIRVIKDTPSKRLASFQFDEKCTFREPLKNKSNTYEGNVFEKLYQNSKQKKNRQYLMEYESRRSRQEKEHSQCTFSPNVSRKLRTQEVNNESFYLKNLEWLERKEKSIKLKQCEKNCQNVRELTFTPKINQYKKNPDKSPLKNGTLKGVDGFLTRQNKAKKMHQFVQARKKNPYSHIWNIKKGCFSNIYNLK